MNNGDNQLLTYAGLLIAVIEPSCIIRWENISNNHLFPTPPQKYLKKKNFKQIFNFLVPIPDIKSEIFFELV